jgi:iron complex outermembrane receptor protein
MCLIVAGVAAYTQSDTVILKEVVINSARTTVSESQMLLPIQILDKNTFLFVKDVDISSVLKDYSAVDIRQRSFSSVQSDISVRGGTFDQTMVLINGINLSDPQTGHHSLNLPINNSGLEAVEVVYGPGSRIFGANAMTGAVNFISKIPEKSGILLDLSYGSFNTLNSDIVLNHVAKKFNQTINLSYSQSDGFTYNTDFTRFSAYYENNAGIGKVRIKTMAGFINKAFGAYSFYAPQYKNQFEKIQSGFAALKFSGGSNIKWEYKIYGRFLMDEFQLFRESSDFYDHSGSLWINSSTGDTVTWYQKHNNHLTGIAGTGFNLEKDWVGGKSAIGAEYRVEQIFSSVLGLVRDEVGTSLYTNADDRQNVAIFAEHGYFGKRILLNAGAMAYYNPKYGLNFYYGADAGFKINENIVIKAGVNKALRLPTVTELYYTGPSNDGNPDLLPEHAFSIETGTKFYILKKSYLNFNLYKRYGTNIIAWVREDADSKWKTENLTNLDTYGIELIAAFRDFKTNSFIKELSIIYSYIYQDKTAAGLESKYTLDHLSHKFIFNAGHTIYKNVSAAWSLNAFKRNGEYLYFDYNTNSYTDSREYPFTILLNLKLTASFKKFDIYLSGQNLTNSQYFDIANVPAPGIAVMGGVRVKIVN